MNLISIALVGLFLLGGVFAFGVVSLPGLSVAPVTFTCVSQSQAMAYIQNYPPATMHLDTTCNPYAGPLYSGTYTPNASGGGTTTTTTTTSLCGSTPYNPATQTCSSGTTSSTVSLSSTTSNSVVTSTVTMAGNSTSTTTTTVVITTTVSSKTAGAITGSQYAGIGLSAFSLIGLVVVNRKGVASL